MTQEDKDLLIKDLCSRLPYGVKCYIKFDDGKTFNERTLAPVMIQDFKKHSFLLFIPYLRPMSSMTEKERKELNNQGYTKIAGELYHYCALSSNNAFYNPEKHPYVRMEYVIKLIDWLNKHHFDYRGLLEKGLALEAPKDIYD